MLKNEVTKLQQKQLELLESITNCTKNLDMLELDKRKKENSIKELELSIEEARDGIQRAKDSRGQEIVVLQQKLKDADNALAVLQSQLDEALLKISAQNTQIRELSDRLEEVNFLNGNRLESDMQIGSLRGYYNNV